MVGWGRLLRGGDHSTQGNLWLLTVLAFLVTALVTKLALRRSLLMGHGSHIGNVGRISGKLSPGVGPRLLFVWIQSSEYY